MARLLFRRLVYYIIKNIFVNRNLPSFENFYGALRSVRPFPAHIRRQGAFFINDPTQAWWDGKSAPIALSGQNDRGVMIDFLISFFVSGRHLRSILRGQWVRFGRTPIQKHGSPYPQPPFRGDCNPTTGIRCPTQSGLHIPRL